MDTKEIFAERDAINRQLTEALSKYGNLEPAHLIGRPYNAGAKSKYTFGAGNYLRLAAIQQAQRFDDPRWLPESFMKKRGLKPAEDAHPVKVEYWENKDGKVHGEERLFYNVAEVPGYTKELLVRKGNEPTDFEYARDLLKVSGIKVHDHATSKEIFDAAKEYAIQNGCNGFAAPIAAQMVLKASFLDMDYTKNRLFNEEQIEKMEKEPKILFHAAQQAQKVLNKLLYAQELEMQKGKEQARIALEARKTLQQQRQNQMSHEPFKDLVITFEGGFRPLLDKEGKELPKGTKIRGEAAYRLLVELNRQDKSVFNRKFLGGSEFSQRLNIRYGAYEQGTETYQIGSLQFGNSASVVEALKNRMPIYNKEILANQELQQQILKKAPHITAEQLQQQCKTRLSKLDTMLSDFKREEQKYLAVHPDIQQTNDKTISLPTYCCEAKDYTLLPEDAVLRVYDPATVKGMYTMGKDSVDLSQRVVFQSDRSLEAFQQIPSVRPVVTPEVEKEFQPMQKFSLEIIDKGVVMEPDKKPQVRTYQGAEAVSMFFKEKKADIDAMQVAKVRGSVDRRNSPVRQMVFKYNGKTVADIPYELGTGELLANVPRGLPKIPNPVERREFVDSLCSVAKVYGTANNPITEGLKAAKAELPSMERRMEAIQYEKPAARSLNRLQYDYYERVALQDLANKRPEQVMKAMKGIMQKDGKSEIKIKNILKTNPLFEKAMAEKNTPAKKATPKERLHQRRSAENRRGLHRAI